MSVRLGRPLLWAFILLAAVGVVYVALLAFIIPLNGLWSGDQGAKLVQILSLISNRFRSGALIYPGELLDPAAELSPLPVLFATQRGEEWYSIYSYPYAALSALLFFVLGYPGLYVVPVLATLGTAAVLAAIGQRLGLARWWLIIPLVGLATPLIFYALVLWEHALAVFLATAVVLCAIVALERNRWRLALAAGLLGGLSYWMRAELLWLAPSLLAGLLWARAARPLLLAAAAGFAVPIGLALLANLLFFGQPLGPQVAANYQQATVASMLATRGANAVAMVLNPPASALLPALGLILALAAAALPRLRPWLLGALALTSAVTLVRDWAGLHTGLTATCPLALAGIAALRERQRPVVRLLLGTALIYTAGVLLTAPNTGGSQWGPRYLLPALALLLPLGLLAVRSLGRRGGLIVLALLVVAGGLSTASGVQLLHRSTSDSLRIIQVVNAQESAAVITDVWYGPQLLAPLYLERSIFFISEMGRLDEASAILQQAGVTRFSYLTAQPWGSDTTLPPELGLRCARVEGFSFGLTLLDCAIAPEA